MRRITLFTLVLLAIEFLDEFVYGAREAAWPLIRDELAFNYIQVGLLLSLPDVVGNLIESVLGILADLGRRRVLALGGGLFFSLALLLTGISRSFLLLLFSFILFYPASGAFVSLSQAALMDLVPERREHNMARWALAGSLGVVLGPVALAGAAALGLGWRGLFLGFAGLALALLAITWRHSHSYSHNGTKEADFKAGMREALRALKRREVLRWLILLEFSDLMLDVLLGFLALYFADVVGVTWAQASVAVAVWTGVGLLGDLLLIPLLERVSGLRYLRWSAAAESILFPVFLLIPQTWAKFGFLGLLGFFNAGWYSILKAQLYAAMPGQSGAVMTVGNLFGWLGRLLPLVLGLAAEQLGLGVAMWLLLLGPIALLLGLLGVKRNA